MKLTSEILARTSEGSKSCLSGLSDQDVISQFLALDAELGFLDLLRNLNSSAGKGSGAATNIILMFKEGKPLEIKSYRYGPEALRNLFILERENPGIDIVLVKASSKEDVRIAFRNYFSDAREFINLVEIGCEKLSGRKIMIAREPSKGVPAT